MPRRTRGLPGTTYVDDETTSLAAKGQCPICGSGGGVHSHNLDAGELAEIEAVRRGERGWGRG